MLLPTQLDTAGAHAILANSTIFVPFSIVAAVLPQVLQREHVRNGALDILVKDLTTRFYAEGDAVKVEAKELANVLRTLFEFDRRSDLSHVLGDAQRFPLFTTVIPALCEMLSAYDKTNDLADAAVNKRKTPDGGFCSTQGLVGKGSADGCKTKEQDRGSDEGSEWTGKLMNVLSTAIVGSQKATTQVEDAIAAFVNLGLVKSADKFRVQVTFSSVRLFFSTTLVSISKTHN